MAGAGSHRGLGLRLQWPAGHQGGAGCAGGAGGGKGKDSRPVRGAGGRSAAFGTSAGGHSTLTQLQPAEM